MEILKRLLTAIVALPIVLIAIFCLFLFLVITIVLSLAAPVVWVFSESGYKWVYKQIQNVKMWADDFIHSNEQ